MLGPPFFTLFFNDAPTIREHYQYHLYADDLTIYGSGSIQDINNIIAKVNSDLNRLASWAADNGLLINAKKTQAIWFGTVRNIAQQRQMSLPPLTVNGLPVAYCELIKLLGLELDSTLSWDQLCNQTAKKCFTALCRLRKCRDHLPCATRLPLIKSLVFPYLDYCAGLFSNLTNDRALKLDRCKNAALRFAVGIQRHEHITPAYIANNILKYTDRRDFLTVCLLASILRYKEPQVLFSNFTFRPVDQKGSMRASKYDLKPPPARIEYYKRSFTVDSINLWNELPDAIRSCYMRPCFKEILMRHFLMRR